MTEPYASRQRPLVVIVDDDEIILRSLRVVLGRYFDVEVCKSALTGVACVQRSKPDVVVLDVRMPVHDGFWAFREVRKIDPLVPIIFNSAYQDAMSQEDVLASLRPYGYLPKSGNLGDFVKLVTDAAKHSTQVRNQAASAADKK